MLLIAFFGTNYAARQKGIPCGRVILLTIVGIVSALVACFLFGVVLQLLGQ